MKPIRTYQGKRRSNRPLWIAVAILLVLAVALSAYLNTYYPASAEALAVLEHPADGVTVERGEGRIAFLPREPVAGLVFYPGGKVEYTAYAPLMEACAQRGVRCVLVEMPYNLAILGRNAADGIPRDYPQVDRWYLSGHSLGGAMAAAYLAGHSGGYEGLCLLAAYSTQDLSRSGLRALTVTASEDRVLNRDKYAAALANLPADRTEVDIAGGCHGPFGSYGAQQGDGTPTIPGAEQIRQTADAIAQLVDP